MGTAICGGKDRHLIIAPVETLQKEDLDSSSSEIFETNPFSLTQTILEITIKCSNLLTENRFQLLSPMAQVTIKFDETHEKVFETEVQNNTLTPVFRKTLKLSYSLSSITSIHIQIFDVPHKRTSKSLIGSNTFSIHEIASRKDFVVKEMWLGERRNGNIHVSAKELKDFLKTAKMKWNFTGKQEMNEFYYLRISRVEGNKVLPVFQTETRQVPLNWEKFEISFGRLCKADEQKKIVVDVVQLGTQSSIIGSCKFTITDLVQGKTFPLMNDSTHIGHIELEIFEASGRESLIEIARSGIEICPFYAIDFSEKYGHSDFDLEHNQYLQSIDKLQKNLQCYTLDPLYTILGSGAIFEGLNKPCYCFALNGNIFQPEVVNHSNLSVYYQNILNSTMFSGSTHFSELLDLTIKFIQNESSEVHKYYSLFILSSGDPQDYQEILKKSQVIVELPLSIFIITVVNDLLAYENLEKLKVPSARPFSNCFTTQDVMKSLDELENHITKYAEYKNLNTFTKSERIRGRSNSLKLSPEKVRMRSNYFTKTKVEYIDYLIKIGYPSEKIEEISQIGVPYVLFNIDNKDSLPSRFRTKTGKFSIGSMS